MTTAEEKGKALIYARDFLRDLLDPKKYPKVPKIVRKQAANRLRHYPYDYELEEISDYFLDKDGQLPNNKKIKKKLAIK